MGKPRRTASRPETRRSRTRAATIPATTNRPVPDRWWAPLAAAARRLPPEKRAAALSRLASAVAERGAGNEAGALALDAWRAAGGAGDAEAARNARALLRLWTPRYHADVATDPARLAAWDAALVATVRPGMRVLDIGTGCGILAMMAA